MNIKSRPIKILLKIFSCFFIGLGIIFSIIIFLAFTEQPFWWYYHLGKANSTYRFKPHTLILLGGAGMPSESNLIRAYYTCYFSKQNKEANVIVALPQDSIYDNSSTRQLVNFLIKNGVDSTKIWIEKNGRNTRQQALNILQQKPAIKNAPVVLITSPEHMYRSIAVFKKVGFSTLGGEPCFEAALDSHLDFNEDDLGGKKTILTIGNKTNIRYQFWNHLKYEVLVAREKVAYFYYYLKDWV